MNYAALIDKKRTAEPAENAELSEKWRVWSLQILFALSAFSVVI